MSGDLPFKYGREKKRKKEHDFRVTAFHVVQEATGQSKTESEQVNADKEKKFDSVALGHLGGLKGGKARAKKLTPEQRKEIAKLVASVRWRKRD